jgi:hypothetical protein
LKARAWAANLALAGLGATAALGLGELFTRVLPPLARKAAARRAVWERTLEVHPRGLYQLTDPSFWTLTPGFSARFVRPYFDVEVKANGQGLRDREFPAKSPQTFRILGLGDSFAFGWGVPLEKSFFKLLEARLNGSPRGRKLEVINAGIPGYGTYEALRLLNSVGLTYQPDLVILAFYEGNDYLNNADAPRSRAIVDGYLTDTPAGERGGLARFALRHSALAALLDEQWSAVGEKRAFRASVEKTKGYLWAMQQALAPRGTPLVLVFIPDQDEGAYARPRLLRLTDRLLRGEEFFAQRAELEAFCGSQNIGFCRLSAVFEDQPESAHLRLSGQDSHLNVRGHSLAAVEIQAWLSTHPWFLEGRPEPGPP